MSSTISFDPSASNVQRADARPSSPSGVRLLNRLSGTRNPEVAGEVTPVGESVAQELRPAVVESQPSASAGDMLESLPDQAFPRKQMEANVKKFDLQVIQSRLELDLLSNVRKAHSAYGGETPPQPKLDIRV